MNKINRDSDVAEIAAIVSEALERNGVSAVLSGGAAVSIYTKNAYVSRDLDFVSSAPLDRIEKAISELGFTKGKGRHFTHEETAFFLEFPAGPLSVGSEVIQEWSRIKTKSGVIHIITPTQSVMDRLAAYYHWNDPQGLDQAVAVAKAREVDLKHIEDWSRREGFSEKFERFKDVLGDT